MEGLCPVEVTRPYRLGVCNMWVTLTPNIATGISGSKPDWQVVKKTATVFAFCSKS
jgi:hypothetical protein